MRSYLVLACAIGSGCYLKPSWSNNPLRSPEGVKVRLIGEDCEDHSGMEGDPVSRDLGVKLRIENQTDKLLRINENAVRLVIKDYESGVRGSGDVVTLKPHEEKTLTWGFTHHVLCDRDQIFAIDWKDALMLDDKPLPLSSLSFKP